MLGLESRPALDWKLIICVFKHFRYIFIVKLGISFPVHGYWLVYSILL